MKVIVFAVSLASFLLLINTPVPAQKTEIPEGVRYRTKPDSVNEAARKLIFAELSPARTYALYGTTLYIGPQLWERYKTMPAMAEIPGGNVEIRIPQYNGRGKMTGEKIATAKLVQTNSGFRVFWDQLVSELSGDYLQIRKLTKKELDYYWTVIYFDIEEPVFIIENGNTKILIQLIKENFEALWIDEVY